LKWTIYGGIINHASQGFMVINTIGFMVKKNTIEQEQKCTQILSINNSSESVVLKI